MKHVLTLSVLLWSAVSFSQDLNYEIRGLLSDIDQRLNRSHDQQTLLRVRERLRSTLDLLSGIQPPPSNPRSNVSCVARDNDGRDPWVLAVKDPITLRQTILPASNIGNLANCEQIKQSAVLVQNSVFVCVTKDNDGRDPWSLAHYRDGQLVSKLNNIGTLQNCITALDNAARSSQAIAFCATRDNDGRDPWIQMSVVGQTGEIHRAGSYSTLDQCVRAKIKLELAK